MTWCFCMPSTFGLSLPDGELVGWDEKIREHFETVLTEDERNEYRGRFIVYSNCIADKFFKNLDQPIEEHEWPELLQTSRVYRELNSITSITRRLIAVDETFKACIESLEPGIHGFRPIRIESKTGIGPEPQYYTLVINTHLDSFDPENSFDPTQPDVETWRPMKLGSREVCEIRGDLNFNGIALDPRKNAGKHFWREHGVYSYSYCMSDELHARIIEAGVRLPKLHKFKPTFPK